MKDVRQIIEEYIDCMEGINEKRIALTRKQLDCDMSEMYAFNKLRNELFQIDGWTRDGIPEDQFLVQETGDDMEPGAE